MRPHPLAAEFTRAVAQNALVATEDWLMLRLKKSLIPSPKERAREIMLLLEGAMALMLIHGERTYADAAAGVAKHLVNQKR